MHIHIAEGVFYLIGAGGEIISSVTDGADERLHTATNIQKWLGSTAPTVGQKTMANSIPVVISSDQTVIPISDNGGSITVDGSVSVSGSVTISDGGGSITVDGTVVADQGSAAALSGYWPVRHTDGTNTQPTGDAIARSIFTRLNDGTNLITIKPSTTAAIASDTALVVAQSPNSSLPVGDNTIGRVKITDGTDVASVNTDGSFISRGSITE
jgi:hypothetical protein